MFGRTIRFTVYSAVVSPSAAVTTTTSELSPATKSEPPVTSKVAFRSVVSINTDTSVVNGARVTSEPSSTGSPSTVNVARETLVLSNTNNVNTYSTMVSSSAAVTVIVKMFSPTTRPSFPEISINASGSDASTSTSTVSVPASSSISSPSTTTTPLIVMLFTPASVFGATFRVTVYSTLVPSAAVTVTTSVFSRA